MTGTRDDADQRFFAALDRLHTRAGKPSAEHLSAVTTRVIGRTTPAKTIQGWLGEKGTDRVVPRKGRGYTCVIGYLLEKSDTPDREMVQAEKEWERRREAAARATAANRKAAAIEVPAVSESVGVPIAQVEDPFALEVHELITADHAGKLPPLPPYVTRPHDERLAAVVQRAIGGESAIAVMLGGSSTGKTRALWEALAMLPQSEWRLWHPRYPTRRQELVASLKNVGPHTVVWLNETQRFFSASAEEQEATANILDATLSDPRRAPILVLGSLWREHYAALCADPGSPARRLLNHETIIEVPAAFTGDDLAAMRLAAEQDPRLAQACDRAVNGEIAQYLAGGPELIDRYRYQVTDAARALIEVAMDAVRLGRLGHINAFPAALLSDAARDYLSDAQWAEKSEDWFEVSVAETSRSCKGTRGPLTPADDRLRGSRKTYGGDAAEPAYQLAEYLDQYGRRRRSRLIPPLSFWAAAAAHAHPDQQYDLGDAACDLGLYREAAQLWKNAAGRGHSGAAHHLVTELHAIFPRDRRPATWVVTRTGFDDMGWVARLIEHLRRTDARDQARTLAKRAATHALPPYIPSEDLASLLRELRKLDAGVSVRALAERAARQPVLDEARGVCWLLEQLPQVGAYEEQFALARRAGADVLLYDIDDRGPWVSHLVFQLQMLGAHEQADVLAKRAARQVDINNLQAVALLLRSMLHQSRTPSEHVEALHERIAEEFVLDDPGQASALLKELLFRTDRHVEAFAQRIAAEFGLSRSHQAAEVLAQLRAKVSEGSDPQIVVRPPIKKVEVATERAPQFEPFRPRPSYLTVSSGQGDRFRFGRKPEDGSPCPAEPWSWSDLD